MAHERERFYRVRNWEKYQVPPRASGWTPPWIKLHVSTLDDPTYLDLSFAERGLLMEMWKLAAVFDNEIPTDLTFIANKLHAKSTREVKKGLDKLMSTKYLQMST